MSQDAADGSADMDLNRNPPGKGRQSRQVLQVSGELFVAASSPDLFSQGNSWNLKVLYFFREF